MLRSEDRLLGPDLTLPAVGRDRKIGQIELARGDRIRFGENLPQFRIRNGTRGTIDRIGPADRKTKLTIRLDDGRLIEAPWTSLVREQPEGLLLPPRITLAYAATAYSVQGRTSAAAVLYIAKPTDAREIYVALTRHRIDAHDVDERDRLEAATQRRQPDVNVAPADILTGEQLFTEARTYIEKINVADHVEDRIEFVRTGQINLSRTWEVGRLNLGRVAQAAKRLCEVAREATSDRPLIMPAWRSFESARQMRRQVAGRVAEVVQVIRARIELRSKERTAPREWDIDR